MESGIWYVKRIKIPAPEQYYSQRHKISQCIFCQWNSKTRRLKCVQGDGRKFCNNASRHSLLHKPIDLARQKIYSKLWHLVARLCALWALLLKTTFHGKRFSRTYEKGNFRLLWSHSFKILQKTINSHSKMLNGG